MEQDNRKSKFLTMIFSLIPGAGYMYHGYLKIGAIYMTVFMMISYLVGLTGIGIFTILLPPLWAYSFFDTFQVAKGKRIENTDTIIMIEELMEKINIKYIGYAFIAIGLVTVVKRALFPLFVDVLSKLGVENIWFYERYVQTVFISIIFIIGGFKLISYNKSIEEEKDNEDDEIED